MIGQRYETTECKHDSIIEKIKESCHSDICTEVNYQCKTEIDSQYKAMFDKKPARVYYMHLEHKTEPLQAIVLFWGLTDEEAKAACNYLLNGIDTKNGIPANARCVGIGES
jgi:hypothetical protein